MEFPPNLCEVMQWVYYQNSRSILANNTRSGFSLGKGFCKMFSEISTVVIQLACCPGKQGELSENCLQNLPNDLMAESDLTHLFWIGGTPRLHILSESCPINWEFCYCSAELMKS